MHGNFWIILGIITSGFSLYAIPHGFELRKIEKINAEESKNDNASPANSGTQIDGNGNAIENNTVNVHGNNAVIGNDNLILNNPKIIIPELKILAENIYFRHFTTYIIKFSENEHGVGVTLEIINKDATKAYIVDGVGYRGNWSSPKGDAPYNMKNFSMFEGEGYVTGQYHLKAGGLSFIKVILPQKFEMTYGEGHGKYIYMEFDGKWYFMVEGKAIEVIPKYTSNKNVITIDEWNGLNAGV